MRLSARSYAIVVMVLLIADVDAYGHGLIEDPPARNWFCGAVTKPDEVLYGTPEYPQCAGAFASDFQGGYQFMSVLTHARGRASVTPLPPYVCGFGSETWRGGATPWDAAVDWPTSAVSPGRREFKWNISWGPHFSDTEEFRYWITRPEFVFQVAKPLSWSDFEDQPFCSLRFDPAHPSANPDIVPLEASAQFRTFCTLPQRQGHHIIYGEWGRNQSTLERFHSCVDVTFDGTTVPSPVQAAIAVSPPVSNVVGASTLVLDGSSSQGSDLRYAWTVNAADPSLYHLSAPNAAITTLTMATPPATQDVSVSLLVSNASGSSSASVALRHQAAATSRWIDLGPLTSSPRPLQAGDLLQVRTVSNSGVDRFYPTLPFEVDAETAAASIWPPRLAAALAEANPPIAIGQLADNDQVTATADATANRIYARVDAGLVSAFLVVTRQSAPQSAFNYGEALQKAVYFYETQRSGPLPPNNRVEWRGDSGLDDGADVGVDLTGGWYDAGDHVKFGLPMAASATMLAWGAIEYRDAYAASGQLSHLLGSLRWSADYFLKAHSAPNMLWGQVGRGDLDHSWWGPAETMQMARPAYRIDSSCPGSDLAGETAAALAASSILFRGADHSYADLLLEHAEQLFQFADAHRGRYSDCIRDAAAYYNSWSGYEDELIWSALWLSKAFGSAGDAAAAESYLTTARLWADQRGDGDYRWTQNWDDKSYGSNLLLAQLTGEPRYRARVERWLDYWTVGYQNQRVHYTPGGLAWLDQWGSLRYAANTALLAFVYGDWLAHSGGDAERASRYVNFAESQLRYILGANPAQRSFVVGFGNQPPTRPHHRTSHGSWLNDINLPAAQRHVLYGALVGGPDRNDQYSDVRSDYVKNEVATDYNAGFTGALARMYREYGGSPLAGFPPPETRDPEIFVQAARGSSGANFTDLRIFVVNQSAWPARVGDNLSLRYFFTLEPGVTPAMISVQSFYNQCRTPEPPQAYGGGIYSVRIDCSNTLVYPGGQGTYRKEIQLRLTSSGAWNEVNDWSAQGLTSSSTLNAAIPVYAGGTRIWGSEPNAQGAPSSTPAPATGTPTAGEPTLTVAPSHTRTSTAAATPTVTHTPTPTRTATSVSTAARTATPTPTRSFTASVPATSTRTAMATPTAAGATATATVQAACDVRYVVSSQWGSGFTADVSIVNRTAAPIRNWRLEWTFAGNQLVTNLWNGQLTQLGAGVSVSNAAWNGAIAAGGEVSFGFQATYSGLNPAPAVFVLNGARCGNSAAPTAVSVPTSTPTPTMPVPTPTRTPTVAPSMPPAELACETRYAITSQWGSGFTADVTVINRGSGSLQGWKVTWAFPGNQRITNLWSGQATQSGATVEVANATWNATIGRDSQVSFGFQATYSGSNAAPSGFLLNGIPCRQLP